MYNILTLNKISKAGLSRLGDNYNVADSVENPDAVLDRSAAMHDRELPSSLRAIARAGAVVNNIPLDKCTEHGIVVFNTPGANANAVKELVLSALFLSSRKIVEGIEWAKTLKDNADAAKLVEKGKSQFVGPEIKGKTLGVIGLGAIGILVANAAVSLGMNVLGYDPFISVDAAWGLSPKVKHVVSLNDIFENSDYITLHVPLTPETKGVIGKENIAKMKDGVRILNFARGDLADNEAVLSAVADGKIAKYITDFAAPELLDVENVIVTPHLGASTPESEDNCAKMAADEIKDYLENGNIKNSVTLPAVSMVRGTGTRICVIHKNVPNMISAVTTALAGANIENMQSKSRKEYAYTILDVTGDFDVAAIEAIDGVIKVRVIK